MRGETMVSWSRPLAGLFLASMLVTVGACGDPGEGAPGQAGSPEGAPAADPPGADPREGGVAGPGPEEGYAVDPEVAAALPEEGSAYMGPVGEAVRDVIQGDTADGREAVDPEAPYVETAQDRAIIRETVAWARGQGLEVLPMGEIMGLVGSTFVGVPYRESPLEVPGEERLVVDLRGMDCVTFVEQVLALAHLVRLAPDDELEDEEALAERFRGALTRIRYRGGEIDGYPSRLHYFSEWISDNEAEGLVEDLTRALGGVRNDESISFMSEHAEAYRRLAEDPGLVEEVGRMEERLSQGERFFIPQEEIAERAEGIRNGDIIAATSTVEGLDVAHTGLAFWHRGDLHLLHAPLQDGTVEITERPLAERIQRIDGQDGIMVARPLEPEEEGD